MHVLLIPTWYPTNKHPIVGSFFREQALLMSEYGFDFKVIQPITLYAGIKKIALFLYKLYTNPESLIDKQSLEQNPPAFSFTVFQNGRLTNKINKKICDLAVRKISPIILGDWLPDVIHGISYPNGAIFSKLYADFYAKPFALVEHNMFLLHHLNHGQVRDILDAYKQATVVGVVSEHQKKMLLMHQPEIKPIVLWNLVDETLFPPKTQEPAKFTILTVTYPAPIKDYKTFLQGMLELSKLTNDFQFIMVGSDTWDDVSKANSSAFEAYAKELNIWHLGTFIPYISRQDMTVVLQKSSVFVVTSIAETYGVAAREAMMSGVPVVTTACGGVEDAITPETGLVVPLREPKQLAEAIYKIHQKEIVYNPNYLRLYSIENFGKSIFKNKLTSFYQNVASA